MLLFQKDRQNGALQGKPKKRSHMDNVDSAVDDLSTAQVNTGDYPVDRKDKETILPAKPACLTGKHTERLLQIRVTGQQRTDGGVQAEDRKADGKQIQSLKSAKQQRKQAGYPAEARCIDKITLVRHQIARQVGEHAPSTACIPDSFLCGGSNVKIIGVRISQVQRRRDRTCRCSPLCSSLDSTSRMFPAAISSPVKVRLILPCSKTSTRSEVRQILSKIWDENRSVPYCL